VGASRGLQTPVNNVALYPTFQDYFRLAVRHPDRITAIISQNRFHLVAHDLPAFGQSDMPARGRSSRALPHLRIF